jgi:lambda family phage tail tape measure protein
MANLPGLVVSLEANMAKFMADMDKAAQKTDQSMLKMAASSDQVQKALKGLESQASRATSAAISLGKGMLLGAAVGMSFDAVRTKVLGVIDGMANLKTISEKTGSSVENLSKLSFFAKQSGSDIDAVAAAMAKMSKGMAGADNETKGAGLALSYLGLSAKDSAGNLKDPGDMIMEVAKKLGEYKDGAGKAAIAQALFGKSGADMLPTLKLMEEQGDIQAKVTDAQATAARQYQRDLAKLDAQQGMLFKTIATALLPTMTDFTNAMLDASKNTNLVNGVAKDLAKDHSIEDWADNGAMALALIVDTIKLMPALLTTATSGIKSVGAMAKVVMLSVPGTMLVTKVAGGKPLDNLAEAKKEFDEAQMVYGENIAKLLDKEVDGTRKAMQAKIDARRNARAQGVDSPDSGKPKNDLNYNSSGEDREMQRKANEAAQEASRLAKNINAGRIKDMEEGMAKELDGIEFSNKYMAEMRAQDLVSVADYAAYRKKAAEDTLAAAVRAYDGEIAEATRYRDTLKKGSEREAEQTKIDTLNAKKERAIRDAGNEAKLATLQRSDAQSQLNIQMKEWVVQQDQAAEQFKFEIMMYGRSSIEVAKLTAARRIQLQVEEEIRQKQRQAGSDKPIDRTEFDKAAAAAKAKSDALYDQADAQQRDPWANLQASVTRYGEEASNVGAQIGNAMTDGLRSAEDAFVQFTMTGKLSFKSLASSILADMARIESRKAISGLLSMATKYLFGGGAQPSSGPGSSGWDGYGNMNEVDGKFAAGGTVLGGSTYLVGERGPEIFKPAGAGTIIPNSKIGGAGGGIEVNVIVNADTGQSQTDSKGDGREMERLGKLIGDKVRETIIQEKRMGGMLA